MDRLKQTASSLEKTLMLGKPEDRGEEGAEGETVGWHHQLIGHELGKTPGDGEGQGSPCCRPWDQIGRHDLATAQQPRSRDTT